MISKEQGWDPNVIEEVGTGYHNRLGPHNIGDVFVGARENPFMENTTDEHGIVAAAADSVGNCPPLDERDIPNPGVGYPTHENEPLHDPFPAMPGSRPMGGKG
jgi:hypothetical protein